MTPPLPDPDSFRWSAPTRSIWGKLDPDSGDALPLVRHLADAAAVAPYVFDWAPRSIRACLSAELGGVDAARVCLTWLASVHDVGKASPEFAVQARGRPGVEVLTTMARQGLDTPLAMAPEQRQHHTVVGQALLDLWLSENVADGPAPTPLSCIVGGHHGRTPSAGEVRRAYRTARSRRKTAWWRAQTEILDHFATATRAQAHLRSWLESPPTITVQGNLCALVIITDWIASNVDLFGYHDERNSAERAAEAVAYLDLPEPWSAVPLADTQRSLADRFPRLSGHTARPLQLAVVDAARESARPPLLIIEAPMGAGKTEAALLAAEQIAADHGCGGLLLALPTMATTDAMFRRALDWIEHLPNIGQASVFLGHSKAGLNDDYRDLARRNLDRLAVSGLYDDGPAAAVAHPWLRGPKKGVLADFVVSTIDQVLLGGLKSKHVVLRLFGLVGKVVVVDEVHAADTYMRHYLCVVLRWLGAAGTPVVLMSATLPTGQRRELVAAYSGLTPDEVDLPSSDAYPRLTRYDGRIDVVPVAREAEPAVAVRLTRLSDDDDVLVDRLAQVLVDGGCIGVIRNTVDRAQQTFDRLLQVFGEDVTLLHSRFMAPDRAAKQNRLVDELGPGSTRRPRRRIVVGTQVLEQSLDIDFDLLVTDLAPVDLILQRIGRLHRHSRERPPLLAEPTCWVTGVDDWSVVPPRALPGARRIYGESALLRSAFVLRPHLDGDPVRLPDDIPTLVDRAYAADIDAPAAWAEVIAEADEKTTRRDAERLDRASQFSLSDAPGRAWLSGMLDVDASEETQARRQVRDSEDDLEVVLVQVVHGEYRVMPGAPTHAGRLIPNVINPTDEAIARSVAACTVRLPVQMCRGEDAEAVLDALETAHDLRGWQQSPWLAGQLILFLDNFGQSHVAGFDLHYDPIRGLRFTRNHEKA